jgi:MSHA biogenesis protein MshQ
MHVLQTGLRDIRTATAVCLGLALLVVQAPASAAPGDTLFYDNLNGNLNDWTEVASGGDASLGIETASQGQSLRLRWGVVTIYSDLIAAAVPGAELEAWIRRGDDSFSENPEAGEDLVVEYRNSASAWILLDTFAGGGTPGEIYTPTYTLPADALHANLSIRFRLLGGSGSDNDYWHVDEVRVTELAGSGSGGSLGVGTCEDFEGGLGGWSVNATGGSASAGIGPQTFNSPSNSLFTEGGVVSVTSDAIDLSGTLFVTLDVWVRRGSNSFSGRPENNENLVLEYLTNGGSWSALETFTGSGTAGQIFLRGYSLPAAALHGAFQIRFRQTAGSGNTDYWHVDDVCLVGGTPISYSLEEDAWTGAPNEIIDGSGQGLNGRVFGNAVNDDATPALATNPGTCRYGDFDGVDDYIEIADAAALDIANELTVTAWIYMHTTPAELHTVVSKDTNYEFHIDDQRRVYWWWEVDNFRTSYQISLNQWHHIAITYRSGSQTIYVDGISRATNNYSGTLPQNDLSVFIGTDYNFISRAFDGYIDEVYILPQELSQAQVQTLMSATHPCATVAAQFSLNHDNFGIHCVRETITVDVIDSIAGTPLTDYNATVELNTQSGRGTWFLASGGGSGTLNDATANDGIATYAWPLTESQAVFELYYPEGAPVINIDVVQVSDPGITDNDAEGDLVFSPNGFTLTAAPLGNPPPGSIPPFDGAQTAGVPFDVYVTAYGQTPNDQLCGVIEAYTGNQNLKFWSDYIDPAGGSIAVQIDGVAIPAAEGAATNRVVAFAGGQAMVSANYKDVGSKQILVKDDTTVNADLPVGGIRGATAAFVVKPYDFRLSAIQDAAGSVDNLGAGDASGPVFIAAGAPFRATVEAIDADGDPTPNYGQESTAESVTLSAALVAPVGGNNPAIGPVTGFDAFFGGAATRLDFVWPEVGIIDVTPEVGDGDYLGAGNVVASTAVRVGRFVPDHFDLALSPPLLETECGPGPNGFTYTGQIFGYLVAPVLTATAKEASGTTTVNYTGDFFKLSTGTLQNRTYFDPTGTLDDSGTPAPVVAETALGVATVTFSSGSGLRFDRSAPQAPFGAEIELSIEVYDADGVAAATNPAVFGASGGMAFNEGNEIRYGRLRFLNAVGSERVNLPVPLIAEYYDGAANGFVANVDDTCTTGVTLALGGFTENLTAACALDSGAPGGSGIGCAAPAPFSQQFRQPPAAGDFNLTLAAPGAGNSGSVTITATPPDYLLFDWDASAAGEENPSGQATFGLFGGEPRQIYLREIFN